MTTDSHFARRVAADAVRVGAALGNSSIYLRSDPRAGLDGLWVAATGRWFLGEARVAVSVDGCSLTHVATDFAAGFTSAAWAGAGIEADVRLEASPRGLAEAVHTLSVRNRGASPARVDLVVDGCFGARLSPHHRKQPPEADIERSFAAEQSRGKALTVRCAEGDRISVSVDGGPAPELAEVGRWTWSACIEVAPGETVARRLTYRVESPRPAAADPEPPRHPTYPLFGSASREVDHGVFWGAVNAARVLHRFRHGWGFTNDPPGDIIVTRDAAWYVMGADWYAPEVSRKVLDTLVAHAPYPDGKIAEYIHMNSEEPIRADYGLNIADPTPLFILAACHHAAVTCDAEWASTAYPVVTAAARYLLGQVRRKWVICTSQATTPGSGQCGWRNILSGIRITGAVTELQAECAAAMDAWGRLAAQVGRFGDKSEADRHAAALWQGLRHLQAPRTGGYRLAMDPDDLASGYGWDDTLDQVFPFVFDHGGKADGLARRLDTPEYRTPWGLRTVPTDAPQYHPTDQVGLVGGVWPNATAWASAALAPSHPRLAWELAADTARLALFERPADHGACVYGEFPEYLNGETGINTGGMAMSPWMGPTFVWLAVERLLGLHAVGPMLWVGPALSQSGVVFARGLRYGGKPFSVLVTGRRVFAARRVESPMRQVRVARDVTARYTDSPHAIVMEWSGGEIAYLAPHADPPADAIGIVKGLRPGQVRERKR